MEVEDVAPALRERLGPEATVGLLAFMESSREEWAEGVTQDAVARFEREIVRQISGFRGEIITTLRAELRAGDASLREEMRQAISSLRAEMREGDAAIRLEMRDMGVALIREIAALGSTLRQEMANQRVELLKWSFAFWVAQFVSIGGLMAILLRSFLS